MELTVIIELLAGLMSADPARINEKTRFDKDLGMDSLDVFQLMSEAEDAFGVDFEPEAVSGFKTAGELTEYVKKRI